MATKKIAPKKAAKTAPSKKKGAVKPAARPASGKTITTKKPAPAAKKMARSKLAVSAKKTMSRSPVPVSKPQSKGAKAPAKKAQVKKTVAQPAKKTIPVKSVSAKPAVKSEPVKKPVVEAVSQQKTKTATKPLESKPVAKEPAKPAKLVIPKTSTDKSIKYEPDFTRSVLDSHKKLGNNPTMRYSDPELKEFKDLINKKLDVAKKELAYLQGLITRKDESGDLDEGRYMTMEDGSMSMEREQLSQMASRQIQFIDHLEKAIMRIENKTYGICRVTGKLIDKARLRAVPHATLSIEAKQMMNK
jgi:RNA polymerase-binding transcription factor DksA